MEFVATKDAGLIPFVLSQVLFCNQFTIRPLFDCEGNLIYFLGLQHDVTRQLQSEEELKRVNQLLGQSDSRIHSEGTVLHGVFDEAVLREGPDVSLGQETPDPAVHHRIRALMTEQPYAVLCTQGGGQPYGSVVAFAANEALNGVVFATPIATRKYRLLSECDRVALVVDNRAGIPPATSRTATQ